MTTVVNVRRGREFDVYVGRAVPRASDPRCRKASIFGNPYKVGVHARCAEEAVELFEGLMRAMLSRGGRAWGALPGRATRGVVKAAWLTAHEWRTELLALRGKSLGCWCHPDPCHAHVLVRLIDELEERT